MKKRILNRLLSLARDSPFDTKFNLVAAIVDGNTPLAIARNEMKTHPLQNKFKKNKYSDYLHAEIAAIKQAVKLIGHDLKGHDIYIVRIGKDGKPRLAKPCEGCQSAIEAFNLRKVFHT